MGEDVALGQAPVLAGGRNSAGVETLFLDQLAHRRRLGYRRRAAAGSDLRDGLDGRFGHGLDRRFGHDLFGRARRGAGAFLGNAAEQRPDLDVGARLGRDLGKHARGLGVDLERHLVGLELDQGLVHGDDIAGRLKPFGDGRLGDRFAKSGNDDVGGHEFPRFGDRAGL